jgi:hypothetical protein
VVPEEIDLFTGDAQEVQYTIELDEEEVESAWLVEGTITVENNTPLDANVTVSDAFLSYNPAVDCGVTFPYLLASGETLNCTYDQDLTGQEEGTNTATVSYEGDDQSGDADVSFAGATVTHVNPEVNVTDTNGETFGPFTGDDQVTYEREFACDADEGQHDNTATIDETGASDDASVSVACWDVLVSKDAETFQTENYDWEITKTVNPDSWDLFNGDTGTSEYTIEVTKSDAPASDFRVEGVITVSLEGGTPIDAVINDVSDLISPDIAGTVDCGEAVFPYDLVSGGPALECDYYSDLPDAAARTNTATAEYQNYSYTFEGVESDNGTTDVSGDADVDFSAPTIITGEDNTATATDDLGTPGDDSDDVSWQFGESGTQTYERTFDCSEEGDIVNTVTLLGDDTGMNFGSDDATVTITCYAITVEKDLDGAYERYWTWEIDKAVDADHESLVLDGGQPFLDPATYEVTVTGTHSDENFVVSGNVSVANPAPIPAPLVSLSDLLTPGDIPVALTCEGDPTFPYDLPAGETLNCTYGPEDVSNDAFVNTATAVLQNKAYHHTDPPTDLGTTDASGSDDFDFAGVDPAEEYDECVDVTDPLADPDLLGNFCATLEDSEETFQFDYLPEGELGFGNVECGEYEIPNTATYLSNDTGLTGDASALIMITVVNCESGCTLTQGYWKTHNPSFKDMGGPPPDETWTLLGDLDGDGVEEYENEEFYMSGKTWLEVFWEPVGGNPYWNLAHQFMAAYLNELNNDVPVPDDVMEALADAIDLFETYAPMDLLEPRELPNGKIQYKKDMELHHIFTPLAGYLASFNEGEIPLWPHCDEDSNSSLTLEDLKRGKADLAHQDAVSTEAASEGDAAAKTEEVEEIPEVFAIGNYPNPFNPTTTIQIDLPEDQVVSVLVFDALGRQVTSLLDKSLDAGVHRVTWDAGNLPSGTYFYMVKSELYQHTKKMLLLK